MKCPVCKSKKSKPLHKSLNLPFTNLKGVLSEFTLVYCKNCNFIYQESAYSKEYDNLLKNIYKDYESSTTFKFPRKDKTTLESLEFILKHIKENANILEIGSARGDFLHLIKSKKKSCNIIGIEPSKMESYVPTINTIFTKNLFTNYFDLVILRHTLEHIKNPSKFIKELESISNLNTLIYIEVPNIKLNLKYLTEDFEPDHVSYFSSETLRYLFKNYEVISLDENSFIRIILKRKKKKEKKLIYQKVNFNNIAKLFDNKERFFVRLKKEKKKVIFYGVSNYFHFLFFQLKEFVNLNNCFYFDDNFKEDIEPIFNLKRSTSFENSIVITCTNVPYVQDLIEEKLKNKNCKVIKPWRQI